MDRAAEIKNAVQDIAGHLDTADIIADVLVEVLDKLNEKVPPEKAAKILSAAGGWLKVAFAPVTAALSAASDKWYEKRVEFIKKSAGVEKISEQTALMLIAIKSIQAHERAQSVKDGMKDNDSKKKSK